MDELNNMNDNVDVYYKHMAYPMVEKAIKSLRGIIDGISIDSKINQIELKYLSDWINENAKADYNYVIKELLNRVESAIEDRILEKHEIDDIAWLSDRVLNEKEYFDSGTSDIQVLHGILAGIAGDNQVNEDEVRGLQRWIDDNYHLKKSFPFDEIESITHEVMKDGKIDNDELRNLIVIFSQFQKILGKAAIDPSELHINGVCSMNPEITFANKLFCFTGFSIKGKRKDIAELIISKGGLYKDNVVSDTDYLVIGVDGNPCWAYSCYGRKVEMAINMRKRGRNILLINEHDFLDSCVK